MNEFEKYNWIKSTSSMSEKSVNRKFNKLKYMRLARNVQKKANDIPREQKREQA